MADYEVKSSDVAALVKKIRQHTDSKALRRELFRGLNSVTKKTRGEMVEAIPAALPRRGGLAEQMRQQVRSRTTAKAGKWAGVSMVFASKGYDVRTLTGQRLRHPVFGNRAAWVEQTEGVEPSLFTAKFEEQKPEVQRAVVGVLDDIARKVTSLK